MIEGICDRGVWQEDEKVVEMIFKDYYSELFTSNNPTEFSKLMEAVQPKVTKSMNSSLQKGFQPHEMSQALKRMYPLRALDPDAMPLPPFFF